MSQSPIEAAWRHCPWGMAVIAADGNVSALNPAYAKYLGRAPDDLLGRSEADLAAQIPGLLHACNRIEVLRDDVRSIHYLSAATEAEVHARHQAGIAEMLREPMASIYGFAELLLTQNYDEETRRDLTSTLMEQVDVMSNIINNGLDTRVNAPATALAQQSALTIRRLAGDPA
jgi:signal transduction histidine kinase